MSKQPFDERNIEYLAKEAKELKKRHQLHDPEAVAVIQAACPDLASPNQSTDSLLRHHDYQTAVARQYGFSDWHKMVSYASGKPRRENGRIVISENKHETLADALNDRASLHGMPAIGTKLNNDA